ncbi:hypothetical protein [Flavobacterium sp. N502536]|uniref:hypothetical protein n=1 Tax=Flavobacterium sp. N502536 TaxID=2986837 RepID=UPI0022221E8E|nr:hypothetical protein [Flavobacterium sp. N502536]
MKKHYLILLLLCINFSRSQSIKSVDSLTIEICKSLVQNKVLDNEIRINTINKTHITPYLTKFKDSIVQRRVFEQVFYRLHKNCNEFVALFPNESAQSSWSMQDEKPLDEISKEECNRFDQSSKYYYFEHGGAKVEVTLSDDLWIEKFADNTFSKLHFRMKSNCEFELEFIESNNLARKNLSIKGDKYLYHLYKEENGTYGVYLKNKETYYTFTVIKQ